MLRYVYIVIFLCGLPFCSVVSYSAEMPQHSDQQVLENIQGFVEEVFSQPASKKVLWLDAELKRTIKQRFNYDFRQLRLRYWLSADRTLWVLDEIGKERPITIGVAVDDGKIAGVKVLGYRESRGGEVQHSFFTRQFVGLEIETKNKKTKLSGSIDGITGATLSVRAVKKVAKLALFLHSKTNSIKQNVAQKNF